jgi:hypothetical protein
MFVCNESDYENATCKRPNSQTTPKAAILEFFFWIGAPEVDPLSPQVRIPATKLGKVLSQS